MATPQHSQPELDQFYAAGSYWNAMVAHARVQVLHERSQARHRVKLALRYVGPAEVLRVLDVGAGHGWIAYWLRRLGVRAVYEYVEPDERCSREIAARNAAAPVKRVASLELAAGPYDLIFVNHVLEHVAEPAAYVAQVQARLAPAAVAYFEVPHADQRFKPDVFPHTWFFTPSALAALASATGAREILRESFGRLPGSTAIELFWRAGFRASANLGLAGLSGLFDRRVWRYDATGEGIWLRWLIANPISPAPRQE